VDFTATPEAIIVSNTLLSSLCIKDTQLNLKIVLYRQVDFIQIKQIYCYLLHSTCCLIQLHLIKISITHKSRFLYIFFFKYVTCVCLND